MFFVKANQPTVHEAIGTLFLDPSTETRNAMTRDRHGNRQERRRLRASSELNDYLQWPGLAQVIEVTRKFTQDDTAKTEVRYAITSLPEAEAGPKRLLALVRGHWQIENRLHYVRDVAFDEDRSAVRSGSAPQHMAATRNFAIGLLHGRRAPNIAAALRTNAAKVGPVFRWVLSTQ